MCSSSEFPSLLCNSSRLKLIPSGSLTFCPIVCPVAPSLCVLSIQQVSLVLPDLVSSYRFYFLKTHISSSRRKCGKTNTSCSSSPTPICPFRRTSHHKSILKSFKSCLINTFDAGVYNHKCVQHEYEKNVY